MHGEEKKGEQSRRMIHEKVQVRERDGKKRCWKGLKTKKRAAARWDVVKRQAFKLSDPIKAKRPC